MRTSGRANEAPASAAAGASAVWTGAALLLVCVVALTLRYATDILDKAPIFDERWLYPPVRDLIAKGWSFDTAIDFDETKGPALIWTYALGAQLFGAGLNDLRLLSVLFFVGGFVPLALIARRCDLGGPSIVALAALYVLMPHNALLGQLVMSEPSFVFGLGWLAWIFVWGSSPDRPHPVAGPVAFGIVLTILLHSRVHAAALAAAVVLVAFERDRFRSWPWLAACAAAALARVPLLVHWGGIVSPAFQHKHTTGFEPESWTYLAAALVPWTACFLFSMRAGVGRRRAVAFVSAGALLGVALALLALPTPTSFPLVGRPIGRYLGFVSSVAHALAGSAAWQAALIGALAVVGAGAIGALAGKAASFPVTELRGVVLRLCTFTLVSGVSMYGFGTGWVFDRYVLSWAALLPLAWLIAVPRPVLALQAVALAAMLVLQAARQLL